MSFLILFSFLSLINVVFSTVRSILTIKGNKVIASLVSGGYFAYYNLIIIYTVSDFPMWQKCAITFLSNVIGVYIVKLIEEKQEKEKLWKIEVTIKENYVNWLRAQAKKHNLSYSEINLGAHILFSFYCSTKEQSKTVLALSKIVKGKYFAQESKLF